MNDYFYFSRKVRTSWVSIMILMFVNFLLVTRMTSVVLETPKMMECTQAQIQFKTDHVPNQSDDSNNELKVTIHDKRLDDGKNMVYATITTYQAVPEQTDSTPCVGAMAGINFCNPPFPIVANDQLPFGAKVKIRGTVYTVADRFGGDYPISRFDILTDGENYKLTNEPVTIL